MRCAAPRPSDVDAIFAIVGDPRACLHNPSDLLTSRPAAENLYRRWDREWRTRGLGYFVVTRRESAEPLGFCGVKVVPFRGADALNLYYRLSPSAWGAGIGSEAATAVVTWARATAEALPIIARVRPANHASQRIATKAGLHRAPHLDEPGQDGLDLIFISTAPSP